MAPRADIVLTGFMIHLRKQRQLKRGTTNGFGPYKPSAVTIGVRVKAHLPAQSHRLLVPFLFGHRCEEAEDGSNIRSCDFV